MMRSKSTESSLKILAKHEALSRKYHNHIETMCFALSMEKPYTKSFPNSISVLFKNSNIKMKSSSFIEILSALMMILAGKPICSVLC